MVSTLGRFVVGAVVAAALTTTLSSSAVAEWSETPIRATVCELARQPRRYAGKHVVTTGKLTLPLKPDASLVDADCPQVYLRFQLGVGNELAFVLAQRGLSSQKEKTDVTVTFDGSIDWFRKVPNYVMLDVIEVEKVLVNGQQVDLSVPEHWQPERTTGCELIAHPEAWEGKLVSFGAFFKTDHMHGSVLLDPACNSFGIVPEDDEHAFGSKELERVVWSPGWAQDAKSITATFTGIFHRTSVDRPRFVLYVTRYDDIKSVPWRDDDPWADTYRKYHPRSTVVEPKN